MALERFVSSFNDIRVGIPSPETSSNRQVIYLSGMLGTGKTSVASLVANRVGATLLGEFTALNNDSNAAQTKELVATAIRENVLYAETIRH